MKILLRIEQAMEWGDGLTRAEVEHPPKLCQ